MENRQECLNTSKYSTHLASIQEATVVFIFLFVDFPCTCVYNISMSKTKQIYPRVKSLADAYQHDDEVFELYADLYGPITPSVRKALVAARKAQVGVDVPEEKPDKIPREGTRYKPEYSRQAHRLCLLGATDKELAEFFEVSTSTIGEWKKTNPNFADAVKRGKLYADGLVAESLFKRATGQATRKKTHFASHMGSISDKCEYEETVEPDTGAAKFWLTNRQRTLWQDRHAVDSNISGDMNIHQETSDAELQQLLQCAGLRPIHDPLSALTVENDDE